MKKLLMMLLVVGMLLVSASGCNQPNQIKQGYKIKLTNLGYVIVMPRQRYTFSNDMKTVWQDDQFRTHIIFWSSICSYPFFGMPFTETTSIIILP